MTRSTPHPAVSDEFAVGGRRTRMTDTTCHMSSSLDGFVAGPPRAVTSPSGAAACDCQGTNAVVVGRPGRPR